MIQPRMDTNEHEMKVVTKRNESFAFIEYLCLFVFIRSQFPFIAFNILPSR
jgi:hypothetical protein